MSEETKEIKLIDKVRQALRIDGNDLDSEIQDIIDACKAELTISGIVNQREDDPLIIRLIICYCRAHFDVTNQDHDKYIASYESLKIHLCLCREYTEAKNESGETN